MCICFRFTAQIKNEVEEKKFKKKLEQTINQAFNESVGRLLFLCFSINWNSDIKTKLHSRHFLFNIFIFFFYFNKSIVAQLSIHCEIILLLLFLLCLILLTLLVFSVPVSWHVSWKMCQFTRNKDTHLLWFDREIYHLHECQFCRKRWKHAQF